MKEANLVAANQGTNDEVLSIYRILQYQEE
jgi:hypothetical protein